MLAYDYPLLASFLTVVWIFVWIAWIVLLFRTIGDIFRSQDLGGGAKALWLFVVILLPYLGVFVYVISRGRGMGERDLAAARAQQEAFDAYVRQAAGSGSASPADELARLAELRDRGVITDAELEQQKAKLLA